jgi:hypothetical protein
MEKVVGFETDVALQKCWRKLSVSCYSCLVLFYLLAGYMSVATPGNAKNTLSIGSHYNSALSFAGQIASIGFLVQSPLALQGTKITIQAPASDFGPSFATIALQNFATTSVASRTTMCLLY